MKALLRHADDVLRTRGWAIAPPSRGRMLQLGQLITVFGILYGVAMGSYGQSLQQVRPLQMLFSGLKVPLLLGVTFALSLPSFFVINSLAGLRDDFKTVIQALMTAQGALTIVLVGVAPLTLFWYVSVPGYDLAILINGAMFAIASLAAQWVLLRLYRPLIARDPRHRRMLIVWLVIYTFVAIQMAWVLRPFIGSPGRPTRFFREEAWGNAYVELARIIMSIIGS